MAKSKGWLKIAEPAPDLTKVIDLRLDQEVVCSSGQVIQPWSGKPWTGSIGILLNEVNKWLHNAQHNFTSFRTLYMGHGCYQSLLAQYGLHVKDCRCLFRMSW